MNRIIEPTNLKLGRVSISDIKQMSLPVSKINSHQENSNSPESAPIAKAHSLGETPNPKKFIHQETFGLVTDVKESPFSKGMYCKNCNCCIDTNWGMEISKEIHCQHPSQYCESCIRKLKITFNCSVCMGTYCKDVCYKENSCKHITCPRCSFSCKCCQATSCVTCLHRCNKCYQKSCLLCMRRCNNCCATGCIECTPKWQKIKEGGVLCDKCVMEKFKVKIAEWEKKVKSAGNSPEMKAEKIRRVSAESKELQKKFTD